MNCRDLDRRAKSIAINYKRCERELVTIISQIDRGKAYYKLGYSSLFSYMTQALELSEAVACNISAVVRKSIEVPQLQQKVITGEISLSKARKLTPVITKANQKTWLKVAKEKTQRQIEREVSLAQPKAAIMEKMNYVPSRELIKEKVQIKQNIPRLKMEVGVSEKLMLKLRRCQDLESQRQKRSVNIEGCLEALVDLYLERKDPVKKAERQKMKGRISAIVDTTLTDSPETFTSTMNNPYTFDADSSVSDSAAQIVSDTKKEVEEKKTTEKVIKKSLRKPIPANIIHQIQLRDQGQCTYKDKQGKRCSSRRHLEIHHLIPVHAGGDNRLNNLRLLCHGHHKMQHLQNKKGRNWLEYSLNELRHTNHVAK